MSTRAQVQGTRRGQEHGGQLHGVVDPADRGKKFIIDPSGQAHTFVLIYSGGQWKQFDNDHQDGVNLGNVANVTIRVLWE